MECFLDSSSSGAEKHVELVKLEVFQYEQRDLKERREGKSVNLTIEIKASSGKFQELYQTFQAILPTIRKKKGCRNCRIYRDLECEDAFSLSVHWEVQANLESYIRSSSGGALLGALDLLSETARVRIDDASWEGLDTLRKMKKKKPPIAGRHV
jgi:quinol monooxygenase YgiN